jgi:anti-sigma regulatory factor (Ser/Thr protein kinase)
VVETWVATQNFEVTAGDVELIDNWIENVGARWQASARTVFGARLCVAELAANVLEHAIATSSPDRITVTLRHCADGIAIEFVDSRTPFDPTRDIANDAAATLDCAEPGGRGLRLLHAYAQDLAYRHDGTFNRVTFTIGPDAGVHSS